MPKDATDNSATKLPIRAMILSVGGTPDPLIASLSELQPEFACFLASQQSVDGVARIKSACEWLVADEKEIVEDPEDLVQCYEAAIRCFDRVNARGFSLSEAVVDYTGGTKSMSAALAMATAARGVSFCYVGGTARSKRGLGTVEAGTERVRVQVNPLVLYAIEERRRAVSAFNSARFVEAEESFCMIASLATDDYARLARVLEGISRAYGAWDRFAHKEALSAFGDPLKRAADVVLFPIARKHGAFFDMVRANRSWLARLSEKTKEFSLPDPTFVTDLVANAKRRIAESKYDDACARLYRAIEMHGQIAFNARFGCEASKARLERLPETLRTEYRRYSDDGVTAKLALSPVFRALEAAGDPAGALFAERANDFMAVMDVRNGSILAHGVRPVKLETAKRILDLTVDLTGCDGLTPAFPRLPSVAE